ncbi:MAG: hypothetical protein IT374_02865 [Polyangiaceae bacterium]|nr:hypothetical protein [Polyangiaceae bacterium]
MALARGLYRTTRALAGEERALGPERLVFALPRPPRVDIFLPERSLHNRWRFPGPPFAVHDAEWLASLSPLRPQGHYVLAREVRFDGGAWPARALVQLGYSRLAEPMIFLAQLRGERRDNALHFGDEGVALSDPDLDALLPVTLFVEPGADGAAWGR